MVRKLNRLELAVGTSEIVLHHVFGDAVAFGADSSHRHTFCHAVGEAIEDQIFQEKESMRTHDHSQEKRTTEHWSIVPSLHQSGDADDGFLPLLMWSQVGFCSHVDLGMVGDEWRKWQDSNLHVPGNTSDAAIAARCLTVRPRFHEPTPKWEKLR